MDDKKLRKLLEQLYAEIEQTESIDPKGQEFLNGLRRDINELLQRSEGVPMRPLPTMVSRLENAISHFEIAHPALTSLLSDLMAALNNAGI